MSVWGKLHATALELAKGTPLKQRLVIAFSIHLRELDADELPPALRAEFIDLLQVLVAVPPGRGESAVQATVRKMSGEAAESIAARLVTLFGQAARHSSPRAIEDSGPRLLNESFNFDETSERAAVVPLFAQKQ